MSRLSIITCLVFATEHSPFIPSLFILLYQANVARVTAAHLTFLPHLRAPEFKRVPTRDGHIMDAVGIALRPY
jgi:hypothetical protein